MMKKYLALLLALVMVLCCAACGNDDEPEQTGDDQTAAGDNNVSKDEEKDDSFFSSGEITLENLMNHPESPESDFEYFEYGDGTVLVAGYLGDDEIVVIPETLDGMPVAAIGSYVFANDSTVRAIKLSGSVKLIETGAFGLNESLEIVVCGASLEEIGEAAFQNCTNLREIILNDGLATLRMLSISGCESLMSIEVPDSVTSIDSMAFYASPDGFTIIGSAGSAVEQYAKDEGINFQAK